MNRRSTLQTLDVHPTVPRSRFDLAAIERTLRSVHLPSVMKSPTKRSLQEVELARLVSGYASVDQLLASDVDLLALGNSHDILELNHIVLYGLDLEVRRGFSRQILASEQYFYEQESGIGDFVEYCQSYALVSVWNKAALACIRMVAEPQLFREGNHRTSVLMISYLLGCHALPPFVLTDDNAEQFFSIISQARCLRKRQPGMIVRSFKLRRQLVALLKASINPTLLHAENPS